MTSIIVQSGQSIQSAVNSAVSGDTIIVNNGTFNERVIVTSKSNLLIQSANNRGAKIDGTGININNPNGYGAGLFQIDNGDHITVQGFDISRSAGSGIQANNSSYISVIQNYVNDVYSSGIQVHASSNILVDGNEIYLACNTTDFVQEVLSFETVTYYEIKNNNIHNIGSPIIGGEGIDVKVGSNNGTIHDNTIRNVKNVGIYTDAWNTAQKNIKVYNNLVQYQGIAVAGEDGGILDGVDIHNNVVLDSINGIFVPSWQEPDKTTYIRNINIYNNTFYNNSSLGMLLGRFTTAFIDTLNIYDNLFVNNRYNIYWDTKDQFTNTTINHNYFDIDDGGEKGTNYIIGGDPLFVDSTNGNFRLQSNSPAIGFGTYPYPSSITVTNPTSGSVYRKGEYRTIKWVSIGNVGINVNIQLLRSGTVVKTISTGTANDGSFSWVVPSVSHSNDYQIKITSKTNSSYSGMSGKFTI